MKKFAQDAWAITATNWILFAELFLNLAGIVTLSIVTVLSPVVWSSLSTQEKFIVVLGVTGQCAMNIQAWLSKSASKIINRQVIDDRAPSIEVTSSTQTDTVKVTTPSVAVEEKEIK